MNTANLYKKILFFFKVFSFFSQKNNKIYLYCIAPVYGLSICKRITESVEGLLRYESYKVMKIASLYKKFRFFLSILIFTIFEKEYICRCSALIYGLSKCKKKIEYVEGLLRYRPTNP